MPGALIPSPAASQLVGICLFPRLSHMRLQGGELKSLGKCFAVSRWKDTVSANSHRRHGVGAWGLVKDTSGA